MVAMSSTRASSMTSGGRSVLLSYLRVFARAIAQTCMRGSCCMGACPCGGARARFTRCAQPHGCVRPSGLACSCTRVCVSVRAVGRAHPDVSCCSWARRCMHASGRVEVEPGLPLCG
jgi:hypothetical protein